MIRPIPRKGESGGSSGGMGSLTPAPSPPGVTSFRNSSKASQPLPLRHFPIFSLRAGLPVPRGKPRNQCPPAGGDIGSRPRPANTRHPIVTKDRDPQLSHIPQECSEIFDLFFSAGQSQASLLHRR